MVYFFLFVLGTIIGSFLNVVALRWGLPAGRQALVNFGGRSICPHCRKILHWYELVPLVSFAVQRGKCRECHARISWQYPLIELWTGLIFVSIFYVVGFSSLLSMSYYLLLTFVFCIYIVITIYDLKNKIIPDSLVYSAILLSVVGRWLLGGSFLDWLSGPAIFSFFALIWFLSRGRAMGFGDAKLGLSVGFLLGAPESLSAIVLAFWVGAIGSLSYIFLNRIGLPAQAGFIKEAKKLTMKSEVPFAPFIILGAWFALVFHLDILHVALF